jgi:hypothetical protein
LNRSTAPTLTDKPARWFWPGTRLALGLSPTPLSGLFLPIGIALGPEGLGWLSTRILSFADLGVSVALAALGVLIGLGLDIRRAREARLLAAASLEAGLTILIVGAGLLALGNVQPIPGLDVWAAALVLGICAAASSTAPAGEPGPISETLIDRVGDLDDVLPILLGGIALALLRVPSVESAALLTAQAFGLALAIACSGWLLLMQGSSESEQAVFTLGTIFLLGGTAEFLSLSPLLAGLVAGTFWSLVGGDVRDRVARDVRHMQHVLVAMLLLVAGARVGFSANVWIFCLAYVVLRAVAKLAGGGILRRVAAGAGSELPRRLGVYLLSPGVVAVAFALSVTRTVEPSGAVLVIAVAGSIASELLSFLARPRDTWT